MNHLFNQNVTIYSQSKNRYGKNVYSSGLVYKGRVQRKATVISDGEGENFQADMIIYLPKKAKGVSEGDRVDYSGKQYRVIYVYDAIDSIGALSHIKIALKRISV
jgi:hypothetical protein